MGRRPLRVGWIWFKEVDAADEATECEWACPEGEAEAEPIADRR